MKAINPFLVLEIDEAATRAEIDAAHRRLANLYHPDRHATGTAEEQDAAAERMAEINYAHEVLTDPEAAKKHRAKIAHVRRRGLHVEPAPQRPSENLTAPQGRRPHPTDEPQPGSDYRRAASSEFTVGRSRHGTPWTGKPARRWFRRD